MKQLNKLLLTLLLSGAGTAGAFAEAYTCNFDTPIDVSKPNFKVASNWKHIPEAVSGYYMTYYYSATNGVGTSGALEASEQKAGQYSWNKSTVNDYIVTPLVKGTVTLDIYDPRGTNSFVEIWNYDEENSRVVGDNPIKTISTDDLEYEEWKTFTLAENLEDYQRLALRLQYVRIDNFTAEDAEITPEPGFAIISAEADRSNDPTPTSGTVSWVQLPDGTVPITYKVKIQNTGEVDLTQGMEKYSLSLFTTKGVKVGESVPVTFDLAKDAESDEFSVTFSLTKEQIPDIFNTYGYFVLQDDFNGEGKSFDMSMCVKYESKFVFCLPTEGDSNTTNITASQSYGINTTDVTKEYQIRNYGIAPMEIVSITYPDGFTTTLAETTFTLDGKERKSIPITLNTNGDHNGVLTIVYKLYGEDAEKTYTLGFSGSKIADGVWYEDFNGTSSTVSFPAGSIVESNVNGEGNSSGGNYDNYIYARWSSDSKFYTPLLHAKAGDTFSFDIKKYSSSSDGLKVYVTKYRNELGEPVMNIAYSDLPSSWEKKSISFDEEGDYIVVFSLPGVQLDNLAGLKKVEKTHDIYIKSVSFSEYSEILSKEIIAGDQLDASATIYALTDLISDEYTVKFILNNEEVATIESVDFDANPKSNKKFKVSFTPETTETITCDGFFRFEFEDGTIFDSPKLQLTISYESKFAFGKSVSVSKNNPPKSDTTPIVFGKTNEPGTSVTYKIANSGAAPLNITSISTTGEFSVSPAECVVEGLSTKDVVISFNAETPGEYEGEIEISYDGMEEPYKLAIQGTMLDPNKWYATFDSGTYNQIAWPTGSFAQSGLTGEDKGSNSAPDMMLKGPNSTKDNMFISPLLKAEAGDQLTISADAFASNGVIGIYAAPTRGDLLNKNEDGSYNATKLGELSCTADDEFKLSSSSWSKVTKDFVITVPEAGEYYIGFELANQSRIDEIVGLTPVAMEQDILLESFSAPSEGMQNVLKSGSMTLRNLRKDIEAGAYTVKSYIDGALNLETEGEIALPALNHAGSKSITIPVSFRSPKPGTYPVYFEFSVGDYVVATDPVEVTFSEEIASSEKQVGDPKDGTNPNVPVFINWHCSESVTLYTAENLGLNDGDKIAAIIYRGYQEEWTKDANKVPHFTAYYQWTDETTQAAPSSPTQYPFIDEMTLCYDKDLDKAAKGKSTEYTDILTFTFDEPLVYQEGKSLRLVVRAVADNVYQPVLHFQVAEDINNTYYHREDNKTFETLSYDWAHDVSSPVIFLSLVSDPHTLSGTVTSGEDNSPVEGATVTMVSNDGDNITYTGETDEKGEFNINVIQSGREYNVEVSKDDKEDFEDGVSVADESLEKNFVLLDVIQISDDGDHTEVSANTQAVAYVQKALNAGFNAVTLPVALLQAETMAVFGDDAVIYEFDVVLEDPEETTVKFKEVYSKDMEAGKPYLVFIEGDEAREVVFKTKGAMASLKTESDLDVDFVATAKRTPVAEKMFVLSEDNFVSSAAMAKARTVTELPAYSGYIKAENASAITFTTDENYQTIINDAEIVNEGEDVIYDLNGIRVKNPEKGIYIINGKAVRVK